jgi:drug/metabolite transporter (DMT)-like permease
MAATADFLDALLFSALRSRAPRRGALSPKLWTCVGALAIPLWSTWPALALWSFEMPAFECLTIAFAVGWLVLALLERRPRRHMDSGPHTASVARQDTSGAADPASGVTERTPPRGNSAPTYPAPTVQTERSPQATRRRWLPYLPAIACAIGLSGSNAFHILATHYIPAAEANLLSYLWPVEIVAAGALLGLFTLRARQIVGLGLGFAGAVVLMAGGELSTSVTGVVLALLSGVSWAAYCVFRLKWPSGPLQGPETASTGSDASRIQPPTKEASANVLATGCAISTALCAGLHFALEPTMMPSLSALGAAAAVGVVPLALGNFVWDEGFRRGDSQLLAVLAYATPLCSALLLGALGLASLTWGLLLGGAIIVTAGVLSRAPTSNP